MQAANDTRVAETETASTVAKDAPAHDEEMSSLKAMVRQLLMDPLLADLAPEPAPAPAAANATHDSNSWAPPSLAEVDMLVQLERGEAFRVVVDRADNESIDAIVSRKGTVRDLKAAIKRSFSRKHPQIHVSWKYIWKTYCIMHDNQRLLDDRQTLESAGIESDSGHLKFARYVRSKKAALTAGKVL